MTTVSERGNKQFGDFLRSRRHRLDPDSLGIPAARRRRTPGLRREEVAERAGISCEWYIKLEQGREVSPSSETIAALAKALVLDPAETAHLRSIAQPRAPMQYTRETVPDIVATIVEGLSDPAYVTGVRGDVLCWNTAADELLGFSGMEQADRNILLWMLTDPAARSLFADGWTREAKRMLALFRVAHDQHAEDASFGRLVSHLSQRSTEFVDWWSSHEIALPSAGTKTLHSIEKGNVRYVYASFQSNDDPTLKLALYRAS